MDAAPAAILAGDKRALSGARFQEDKHRRAAPRSSKASATQALSAAESRPYVLLRPLSGSRPCSIYHMAGLPIFPPAAPLEWPSNLSSPVRVCNGQGVLLHR